MGRSPPEKKQLGKILLKQQLVTNEELTGLLEHQKTHPGQRLASAAQATGAVADVDLLKALSEQHGLPGIDLSQVVVPLDNLKLIPVEIARQHLILPILVKEDRIFLAMADPGDRRVLDEIEFVTGRKIFPYVALHDALREVIEEAYRQRDTGRDYYIGTNAPPDYLESLGLSSSDQPPSQPPDPTPGGRGGVVVDRTLEDPDDDLGLSELTARGADHDGPGLDPAFGVDDAPSERARRRPSHPKILVVDDEDDIRRLLRRVLQEKGYQVIEAAKGLEALHAVRAHVPDVILLDAMLPEVHGFDICRRIKGSKRYGNIPIIMVSAIYRGWRVAEDLKQSYGVEVFLEKPFKISDVVSAVEHAVDGRGAPVEDSDEDLSREAGEALNRGIEAYKRGELDSAIASLQEGLSIDPLSFQLHYHLGLLYGRRDNVFEAIHELETAVDLQPRNFSVLRNLAVLYQRAGFKHKAIEMWERALGNAPDDETRQGIKDHLMSLL